MIDVAAASLVTKNVRESRASTTFVMTESRRLILQLKIELG